MRWCSAWRPRSRDRAQALVEFSLVVPALLLLVVGVLDFARLLFTYISLANGTREFARSLAIPANSDAAAIAAFNNTTLILGATGSTDRVVVLTANADGTSPSPASSTCSLPLSGSSCVLPARPNLGGSVTVTTTYRFVFVPLFETTLQGNPYVTFLNQAATLTTATREYNE